ncbi:MAG: Spy/CpxP family protein refolding chaperone [Symploca sp. SIO2E9]|nr:Spy/CpxP family protein refolding chaperone [Symploca sp. SIO2E9]
MITWRHFLVLATAPILVSTSGSFALAQTKPAIPEITAQRPAPNGERPKFSQEPRWLQELDLSAEQSERIKAIRQQSRQEMESRYQEMQEAREQMQSLMAGNATREQLRQQHQQLQNIRQELGNQRFETMLDIREVLTPQQRAQMAELAQQHRGHWGRRGPRRVQ